MGRVVIYFLGAHVLLALFVFGLIYVCSGKTGGWHDLGKYGSILALAAAALLLVVFFLVPAVQPM